MPFYAVCIGYTKYVASISDHVKIGSVTCLFWLPLLENRGSQNSSEQSCDSLPFNSISVPKIWSTPNSKWSSLLGSKDPGRRWSRDLLKSSRFLISNPRQVNKRLIFGLF
jgi:hypothetical protein